MKKRGTILTAVLLLASMLVAGTSQAAINGTLYIPSADIYNESTHDLTTGGVFASPSLGLAQATFTVDSIDFFSPPSTYADWLSQGGTNGLNITSGASVLAGPIVTSATTSSIFQFTGSTTFPASFRIYHDDGIQLYIDGVAVSATNNDSSYPTPPEFSDYTVASGPHSFTLNYAAWNGFPEVLSAPDLSAVPEPTTLLLLGLGLAGVAGVMRRRIKK